MSGDLAVQCTKLPDWLLARRVIPENYARLLAGVEAKIVEALAEPVSDEAAKELISKHSEGVSYFVARDIYEAIAKSPEGQAKSLLGGHTHPAAAKWRAVVDAYRKRHLGWISAARVLVQNVGYEIPALKKQVAACERQVTDCTQRQADLQRIESNAKNRHEALLKELGIEGHDPRFELRARAAAELPKVFTEVAELLQGTVQELATYYDHFAVQAAGRSPATGSSNHLVPIIRFIAQRGECVPIEDVEKEVPHLRLLREEAAARAASTSASAPPGVTVAAQAEAAPTAADGIGGIDWGVTGASNDDSSGAAGINWDLAAQEGASTAADGIDWGIEVTSGGVDESDGVAVSAEPVVDGIDWGAISFEGLVEVQDGSAEAASPSTASIFDDAPARELLYQEVLELDAFLQVRLAELSGGSTVDYSPEGAQKTLAEVKVWAEVIQKTEELLAGKRTQQFLMLKFSDRYLDQQVQRIEASKAQCIRPVTQRAALDKVKAEQAEEARRTRAEIDKLREATRKIQRELEAELSAHFKSSVRIVGEINQM